MKVCSGGGSEGVLMSRGLSDARRHPPSWEPTHPSSTMPRDSRRSTRNSRPTHRQQVPRRLRRPGQKCPWAASQPQPSPLAVGIQYSIVERLPLPSACLIGLVFQSHTAEQSLSQDISLFPRHVVTSLFLPVLKHTVLASVCNLKCQVPFLRHHKGVSYP